MARGPALRIVFDDALDRGVRVAFEAALQTLLVDSVDISMIDADPEGGSGVDLVLAAPGSTLALSADARRQALLIVAGPSLQPASGGASGGDAVRITAADIVDGSRRWAQLVARIGETLGRPGLGAYVEADSPAARAAWAAACPTDPLAADLLIGQSSEVLAQRLAETTRRAEAAEAALAQLQRAGADDQHRRKLAEADSASGFARIRALEAELARLSAHLDIAAYPLAHVSAGQRPAVEAARDAAARARLSAAAASAAAERYPGALIWAGAAYSGETRNQRPHGAGVMTFPGAPQAWYRGAFRDGRREGYGVGRSADGSTWAGGWQADQACGSGVLDAPDGRRFEGEARTGLAGAVGPTRGAGWRWDAAPGATAHGPYELRPSPAAALPRPSTAH